MNRFNPIGKLQERMNNLREFAQQANKIAANEKLVDSLKEPMKQVVASTSELVQQAIVIAKETTYQTEETLRAAYLLSLEVYQYHYQHNFAWDTYLDPNVDYHDGSGGDRKLRLVDEQSQRAAEVFLQIQEIFTEYSRTQASTALSLSQERAAQAQKEKEELKQSLNQLTKVDAYLLLAMSETCDNDEEFKFFVELKESKSFKCWDIKGLKLFTQDLPSETSAGSTMVTARGTIAAIAALDKHADVVRINSNNRLRPVSQQ
jgi:hypothetical protein